MYTKYVRVQSRNYLTSFMEEYSIDGVSYLEAYNNISLNILNFVSVNP